MRHIASIAYSVTLIVILGLAASTTPAEAKPAAKAPAKDTTPPTIVCPANITKEAEAPVGATVVFSASVTDDTDPSPTVTYSPASGSVYPIATTKVTVTATDWKRNTSKGTFYVTVRDTKPPSVVCPPDIFRNANDPGGAAVTFVAKVKDLGDASPTITYSPASGSTFHDGTTTVTVTATDRSGNSATGTFHVTYDADPTRCPFAGNYAHSWIGWDYLTNDPLVWFEWTYTIAPDGTVSGQGVQRAVAVLEVDEEWTPLFIVGHVPMPSELSLAISVGGHVTDSGSLQFQYMFNEWVYLYMYDYYNLYPPSLTTTTAQVSLDADGNLVLDDGEVWYRK